MSELSIAPYFPFRRIKIVKQVVDKTASKAFINIVPIINYLAVTNIEVGLLLNFGRKPKFKRFVYDKKI